MRQVIADLFISLDGFASGKGEAPYFGYFGPELWTWVRENLDQPQSLIMGRATYAALAEFSASATDEVSLKMKSLPKLVFSSKLQEPLEWANTHVLRGNLADEINRLKQQGEEPLRCIGSISLVKSMMELRLVDRLRLMVFPVILGNAGREPVFAEYARTKLELASSRTLDSRIMLLEYGPRVS
ncbi:MAG: dihydrofolate reductase family protein [Terriglobales bacterium]